MANERFITRWVPRIGARAAAELRYNAYLTLVIGPAELALAAGCTVAFGSGGAAGLTLGLLGVLSGASILVVWMRSRLRLAAALSQRFGVRIGWQELPRMRADEFDAWSRRRNLMASSVNGKPSIPG